MKPISKLAAVLTIIAATLLSGQQAGAQNDKPDVCFVRIVNAVSAGDGKANINIDGEDIFPKGYDLGQRTGGFGLKAGVHTVTFKKTGVEFGTTKITLFKGETITLIGFSEKLPPKLAGDPPVWQIKILRLKQSDPESGYRLAVISLCPQDELKVLSEIGGKKSDDIYAKRMVISHVNLGKSKPEVLLKLNDEILTLVAPEDPGNYVVVLYLDPQEKVKAISFYDPKFVIAG